MSCISGVVSGPLIWRKPTWLPPWRSAIAAAIAARRQAVGHGTRCLECLPSFPVAERSIAPLAGVSGARSRWGTTTPVTTTAAAAITIAEACCPLRLLRGIVLGAHPEGHSRVAADILRLPA